MTTAGCSSLRLLTVVNLFRLSVSLTVVEPSCSRVVCPLFSTATPCVREWSSAHVLSSVGGGESMNLLTSIIRCFLRLLHLLGATVAEFVFNMLLSRQEQPHNIVAGNTLLIRGRGQSQDTTLISVRCWDIVALVELSSIRRRLRTRPETRPLQQSD